MTTDIHGDDRYMNFDDTIQPEDSVDVGADEFPENAFWTFMRGDANHDGTIDVSDPVGLLASLFVAGTPPPVCEVAANANGDSAVDISDAIFLLAYLFAGGPAPAPPDGNCDTSSDPNALLYPAATALVEGLECNAKEYCP